MLKERKYYRIKVLFVWKRSIAIKKVIRITKGNFYNSKSKLLWKGRGFDKRRIKKNRRRFIWTFFTHHEIIDHMPEENLRHPNLRQTSVWFTHSRSSHRKCSLKKGVLKSFTKFTGKHLCQYLFFNKACNFI